MRMRRQFQPTIELMPLRLAPSTIGTAPNPMNPLIVPSTPCPTLIDPMDPLSTPTFSPSDPASPVGPGSYTPPSSATPTMLC
ncbi:MAG: hypothetical protein ACP5XB_01140 [Isosphaeraceae bacterium]